jgi:hypothetical protein
MEHFILLISKVCYMHVRMRIACLAIDVKLGVLHKWKMNEAVALIGMLTKIRARTCDFNSSFVYNENSVLLLDRSISGSSLREAIHVL